MADDSRLRRGPPRRPGHRQRCAVPQGGEAFRAEVVLARNRRPIWWPWPRGQTAGTKTVRVVWDRYSEPRYRFSIDDNSFFLRDIAQKNYASLFDCFYLKVLRDLHKKYGTKFSLNIYYVAADDAKFPTDADFKLPQFPDRYKGEWRDNAHWLKLAFHAYANMPDRPYQDAPPEKLIADLDLVAAEIHRFAGAEVYAPPTVIHFAMTRHSAFKPLYQRGVRVLTGGFWRSGGKWDINYNWDDVVSAYCAATTPGRISRAASFSLGTASAATSFRWIARSPPWKRLAKVPNTAEILDLFTHEQYFWPFYFHYIPDHLQRTRRRDPLGDRTRLQTGFLSRGFLGGRAATPV